MDVIYHTLDKNVKIDYFSSTQGGKMAFMHYHDAYEVYVLERGNRTYLIDGTFVELGPKDVAFIKPYELHSTDGGIYSRYLLYFKKAYAEKFFTEEATEKLLTVFENKKITFDSANYEKFKELLLKLRADNDDFIAFAEIMQLFRQCADNNTEYVSDKNKLISRIVKYLTENYLKVENLDELADRFFITKSYLCRLFKKETGVSVVTYVNTYKIQKACEKLQFTRANIDKIAADCGFSSSMYFCKLFKRTIGMRPGEYRKQMQD